MNEKSRKIHIGLLKINERKRKSSNFLNVVLFLFIADICLNIRKPEI